MVPMVNASIRNTGVMPSELVADAGSFREAAIHEVEERGIDVDCPPDNGRKTERGACPLGRPPTKETFVQRMRGKVRSEVGRAHYRYRKFVVEPVFGHLKQGRGLRQFLLRGFAKVRGKWKPWALTHNLRKLHLASRGWAKRSMDGRERRAGEPPARAAVCPRLPSIPSCAADS